MDPKPEYLVLLAQAQSKNPNWQRHAVGSYRSAHEMKPEDPGILVGLAKVLEEMGEFDDARQQFGAALELMPDHPEALAGLERLGRGSSKGVSAGSFRSLFGGNSEE
jgi:Flp pilus assembly protein TadD